MSISLDFDETKLIYILDFCLLAAAPCMRVPCRFLHRRHLPHPVLVGAGFHSNQHRNRLRGPWTAELFAGQIA